MSKKHVDHATTFFRTISGGRRGGSRQNDYNYPNDPINENDVSGQLMTDDPIGGPDYGDGDFVPNGGQQGFVGSPGWQASQRLLAEQDVAVEDDMAREEVQFNDEERALVQIAKSFKKSGISMSNARALDDLRLGTLEEDEDGVLKG